MSTKAGKSDTDPTSILHVDKALVGCERTGNHLRIKLDRIVPDPSQPRNEISRAELENLAESLRSKGQLQPCVVRYDADRDKFVLIVGERRFRAAKLAKLESLSCIVDFVKRDETETLLAQIVENEQREALSPIERANAYALLMERHGWTAKQLAQQLNLHPGTVSRALALLKLSDEKQQQVLSGRISAKKARAALTNNKPKKDVESPVVIHTNHGVVTVQLKRGSKAIDALAEALKDRLSKTKARGGAEAA